MQSEPMFCGRWKQYGKHVGYTSELLFFVTRYVTNVCKPDCEGPLSPSVQQDRGHAPYLPNAKAYELQTW